MSKVLVGSFVTLLSVIVLVGWVGWKKTNEREFEREVKACVETLMVEQYVAEKYRALAREHLESYSDLVRQRAALPVLSTNFRSLSGEATGKLDSYAKYSSVAFVAADRMTAYLDLVKSDRPEVLVECVAEFNERTQE